MPPCFLTSARWPGIPFPPPGRLERLPRLRRYYGMLRLPAARPGGLCFLVRRYRPGPRRFVYWRHATPVEPQGRARWAGGFKPVSPVRHSSTEAAGPPRFLEESVDACPGLRPRRTGCAKPLRRTRYCLPQFSQRRLRELGFFRGSIAGPAPLTVYASQPRLLGDHARLASGGWLGFAGRAPTGLSGGCRRPASWPLAARRTPSARFSFHLRHGCTSSPRLCLAHE